MTGITNIAAKRFIFPVIGALLFFNQAEAKEVYRSDGTKANVPLMAVKGTNVVDVGTVHNYAITNVIFMVANTGAAPVKIERLIPLCTCITAKASSMDIAPGGEVAVTLRLDPIKERGDMDRSIWVLGSDTDTPYLKLTLTGKAVPLFSGLPKHPVAVRIPETGTEIARSFSLVASVPGVRLGQPVVKDVEGLKVGANIAETAGDTAAYELKATVSAAEPGNYRVAILLPVQGLPEVEPMEMTLTVSAGEIMTAFPRNITLALSGAAQSARLVLRGKGIKLDPAAVKWAPEVKGVNVEVTPGRGESELLVKIEVTPEAADALYREKDASIAFRHPGIGAATVPVEVAVEPPEGERARGRRRPGVNPRDYRLQRKTPNLRF